MPNGDSNVVEKNSDDHHPKIEQSETSNNVKFINPGDSETKSMESDSEGVIRENNATMKGKDREGFLLYEALSDAGLLSYDVVGAEVWVLDETETSLIRPPGGFWICPGFYESGGENKEAILRLIDSERSDYVPPAPLALGTGLAGILWREVHAASPFNIMKKISSRKLSRRGTETSSARMSPSEREIAIDAASDRKIDATEKQRNDNSNQEDDRETKIAQANNFHNAYDRRKVVWREVSAIVTDPFQPYSPRLNLLAKAGFGLAAGVEFNIHGCRGLVVYMTRESADKEQMKTTENEAYLRASTTVCGAICAFQAQRQIASQRMLLNTDKVDFGQNSSQRTPIKGQDADNKKQEQPQNDVKSKMKPEAPCLDFLSSRLIAAARKSIYGGNVQPPPAATWIQSLINIFGVFSAIAAIALFSNGVSNATNAESFVILPVYGALVTLQYGLTAAPASQPRNILFGQAIGMSIGMAISKAAGLELWLRQSLSAAVAVGCMSKLGTIHPPGGALAIVFSAGNNTWNQVGTHLAGDLIAIAIAAWINNLSYIRQYPTFWGVTDYWSDFISCWKN